MIIQRAIQPYIEEKLFKGKIIILYGARQVGKTTLVKEIQKKYGGTSSYLSCDEPDVREAFTDKPSTQIRDFIGGHKLVILDEAQRVRNIGLSLKLIADNYPDVQVIATGSSSFELANSTAEPLTGRSFEFLLHPLSMEELSAVHTVQDLKRMVETRIIYGMYPEVVLAGDERGNILTSLANSYLYKDVLIHQRIRRSDALEKLLQALALQIGSEVSYTELGETTGLDKRTVEEYVQVLEKAFIVFRLKPFSRNLRNEMKKLRKIYFHDTGVRNAIIRNFNPLSVRTDGGALWENFIIAERMKRNGNSGRAPNVYFWRDHQKREIDYLEEEGGALRGFEIKMSKKRVSIPKVFLEAYDKSTVDVVSGENFMEFIC